MENIFVYLSMKTRLWQCFLKKLAWLDWWTLSLQWVYLWSFVESEKKASIYCRHTNKTSSCLFWRILICEGFFKMHFQWKASLDENAIALLRFDAICAHKKKWSVEHYCCRQFCLEALWLISAEDKILNKNWSDVTKVIKIEWKQ